MNLCNRKIVVLILFVAVLVFVARSGNGQDTGEEQVAVPTEESRQETPAVSAVEEKREPAPQDNDRKVTAPKVPAAAEKAVRRRETPPRPAEPVRAKEQPAEAAEPAQNQQYQALAHSGGVLDMEEGTFRYSRIPEKVIPAVTADNYIAPDQGANGEFAESPGERRGLFGFGPDATGYIAKGVLVFVIILIFIMYRMRSGSRDNKVLRRFP